MLHLRIEILAEGRGLKRQQRQGSPRSLIGPGGHLADGVPAASTAPAAGAAAAAATIRSAFDTGSAESHDGPAGLPAGPRAHDVPAAAIPPGNAHANHGGWPWPVRGHRGLHCGRPHACLGRRHQRARDRYHGRGVGSDMAEGGAAGTRPHSLPQWVDLPLQHRGGRLEAVGSEGDGFAAAAVAADDVHTAVLGDSTISNAALDDALHGTVHGAFDGATAAAAHVAPCSVAWGHVPDVATERCGLPKACFASGHVSIRRPPRRLADWRPGDQLGGFQWSKWTSFTGRGRSRCWPVQRIQRRWCAG
mmetsp:Transcript_146930/g.381848  ORF Transcript_146930/g.381848 Transcript_146930/m.381848 type:complete len:305 (+) Transcript_146930:3020-3934(+)